MSATSLVNGKIRKKMGRSIYGRLEFVFFFLQVILLVYRSYLICEHPNSTFYIPLFNLRYSFLYRHVRSLRLNPKQQ